MNRIAERIMKARLAAKLTEKQLAKKCGLTASYIIQVESGKKIINEQVAEKIFSALGEKSENIIPDNLKEEVVKAPKKVVKESYNIKPNAQWDKALEGVLKKYPVVDILSDKIVEYKQLPILGRKVEGFPSDKIYFFRYNDNHHDYRIQKNDIVMIVEEKEIKNDSLYLIQIGHNKTMRLVRKESNNRVMLSKDKTAEGKEIVKLSDIKVLGRCVKVEFKL